METNIINKHSKRRIVSQKECEIELRAVMPLLFVAFNKAVQLYKNEIMLTPPNARTRNHEATYFNSKIRQCILETFPDNCLNGKYGRFVLRIGGYQIQIKKLDRSNKPMYNKTKASLAQECQLTFSFFGNDNVEEPILYFGYQKNSFGEIISPKLVFIDEHIVKWMVLEDIITNEPVQPIACETGGQAVVTLRGANKEKRTANN